MLKCPVCGTENNDLDIVCRSCKGFMQAKVDNLDLFSTIWGIFESPRKTFRRIAIARSKNYVVMLNAAFGMALVFTCFWHWQIALKIPSLLTIVGLGVLVGIPAGNLVVALAAFGVRALLRLGGTRIAYRNAFAVLAYAGVPVVLSLVLLFPLEIGIFGVYFFDNNPPPIVINPPAYIGLIGLDTLAGVWSVLLVVVGLGSVGGTKWWWNLSAAALVAGLIAVVVLLPRIR
jgi:hypothetical protein